MPKSNIYGQNWPIILVNNNLGHIYQTLVNFRDLSALSVHPLLVQPTHYTGEQGYVSDTEDTGVINIRDDEEENLDSEIQDKGNKFDQDAG